LALPLKSRAKGLKDPGDDHEYLQMSKKNLTASKKAVTPLKNGVQWFYNWLKILDSSFHRNDGKRTSSTFYELINFN